MNKYYNNNNNNNNNKKGNDNVRTSYEPRDIFIEADKGRISQVIFNLLSDALKFTTHGSISIIPEKRMVKP
jgi:signal transduction histidine kinase